MQQQREQEIRKLRLRACCIGYKELRKKKANEVVFGKEKIRERGSAE